MIPPDHEIYDVERQLAERRERVDALFHESGRRTLRALASPGALAGAAVLGFVVGGLLTRPKVEYVDRRKDDGAAKKGLLGSLAGVAMTAAMWGVRSQFGGPAGLAQFLLDKWHARRSGATAPDRPARPYTPMRP